MKDIRGAIRGALRDEHAQDLLEYSLLVALIVIVAMVAVENVGTTLSTVFWDYIAATAASL